MNLVSRVFAEYHGGKISFDEFARRTRAFWQGLAIHLLRKWPASTAVDETDVVQELLLAAWRYFPKYDPTRGSMSLSRYVCFMAAGEAKLMLHHQRGNRRGFSSDKKPARHDLLMADLLPQSSDPAADMGLCEVAEQDFLVNFADVAMKIIAKVWDNPRLSVAVEMLGRSGGDLARATSMLYEDRGARLICEISSIDDAERVAIEAARAIREFEEAA